MSDNIHLLAARTRANIENLIWEHKRLSQKKVDTKQAIQNFNFNDSNDFNINNEAKEITEKASAYMVDNDILTKENSDLKAKQDKLSSIICTRDQKINSLKEEVSSLKDTIDDNLRQQELLSTEMQKYDRYLKTVQTESDILKSMLTKIQDSFLQTKEELTLTISKNHEYIRIINEQNNNVENYIQVISELKEKEKTLQESLITLSLHKSEAIEKEQQSQKLLEENHAKVKRSEIRISAIFEQLESEKRNSNELKGALQVVTERGDASENTITLLKSSLQQQDLLRQQMLQDKEKELIQLKQKLSELSQNNKHESVQPTINGDNQFENCQDNPINLTMNQKSIMEQSKENEARNRQGNSPSAFNEAITSTNSNGFNQQTKESPLFLPHQNKSNNAVNINNHSGSSYHHIRIAADSILSSSLDKGSPQNKRNAVADTIATTTDEFTTNDLQYFPVKKRPHLSSSSDCAMITTTSTTSQSKHHDSKEIENTIHTTDDINCRQSPYTPEGCDSNINKKSPTTQLPLPLPSSSSTNNYRHSNNSKVKIATIGCASCGEEPYGLMMICNGCREEFHSLCARTMIAAGKKLNGDSFYCHRCNNDISKMETIHNADDQMNINVAV